MGFQLVDNSFNLTLILLWYNSLYLQKDYTIIKKILFFFLLLQNMLYSKEHIIPTLTVAMPDLTSIEKHAITIEGGEDIIYVFVDPFCKYSKAFIKKITNKNNSFGNGYTYKIFLLKLKKFESLNTIKYILNSKNKLEELKKIMIEDKQIVNITPNNKSIDSGIEEVLKVSKHLDIYKRPYLFVVPTDWKDNEEDWGEDWDDEEDESEEIK